MPITTLCIAWLLANPLVTSVIIGPSRFEHLTDLLAAADCKLGSELKAQLDTLSLEYRRGDTENEQPQTNASVVPAAAPST